MTSMLYTIDSDDEIEPDITTDDEDELGRANSSSAFKKAKKLPKGSLKAFQFEFDDGEFRSMDITNEELKHIKKKKVNAVNQDNIRLLPHSEERLNRAQEKKRRKDIQKDDENQLKDEEDDEEDENHQYGMSAADEESYFDSVLNTHHVPGNEIRMFTELSLSRPLLRGVEAAGYTVPTPVQVGVIPLALAGRDVCASAVTGSGKTAAFLLPCLERLQYRQRGAAAIRVLVVTPTRELAMQIYLVLQKLSTYTDVTSALICGGGKDTRSQEATLRLRPDIVICTPGRFLDHLRNSPSVRVDELDVLVLDEVDRLLDLGFTEEVEELVRQCPIGRQTLLFSATMTNKVEDLVRLSLRKPVRVKTSLQPAALAPRLIQEFVKVRVDEEREAVLISLISRSFNERVIVFCETKRETHRVYLLLRLLEIPVCQLHGDMTQAQRFQSLDQFRNGGSQVLVATDVAARGLDIPGVLTVINAEMPISTSTYIHRVGRTARAGSSGRAITLVTDARRKVVKDMLKSDAALLGGAEDMKGRVLSRTVPAHVVSEYATQLADIEPALSKLSRDERLERQMNETEAELSKAQNLLLHEDEIAARPARTWYQTETQKQTRREMTKTAVHEERKALLAGNSKDLSAVEKRNVIAHADDYRDDGAGKKDMHRLSRKKRRRLSALEESAQADEEDSAEKKSGRKPGMKPNAKVKGMTKKDKPEDRSLAEIGQLRELKKRSRLQLEGRENVKKTTDLMRPRIAVGGLDSDLLGDGASSGLTSKRAKLQQRKMDAEMSFEFDPNKRLRKGGKSGTNSFKSKKRYKRR